MVELAKAMQGLVESFGFPVAICVVLLIAIWWAAKAIKGWIERNDAEAMDREMRLAKRLDQVQDAFTEALRSTIDKTQTALSRNTGVMERLVETNLKTQTCLVRVDSTLIAVRRRFEISSGGQKAIED